MTGQCGACQSGARNPAAETPDGLLRGLVLRDHVLVGYNGLFSGFPVEVYSHGIEPRRPSEE